MQSLAAITLSVGDNQKFVISKAGGLPAMLYEGPPSSGKTTMTLIKRMLYGIKSDSSILTLNNWSASMLCSLRDQLKGFVITYVRNTIPSNTECV